MAYVDLNSIRAKMDITSSLSDAAFNNSVPSYDLSGFQSVSEQLGTGNLSTTTLDSLSSINNGNLVNFDFHLYSESVGVEKPSEPNKTYFVGETCKRYPNASTCKNESKKQKKDEYYMDYSGTSCHGTLVKGKKPATQPKKSKPGAVCLE